MGAYHAWPKRFRLAMEMGEHDLMGKQRNPLKSGNSVSIRAANQFMLAVVVPDEQGNSKLTDNFLALAFG